MNNMKTTETAQPIQIKVLLLDTLFAMKHGTPVIPTNKNAFKRHFKEVNGLPKNTNNQTLLEYIGEVYRMNKAWPEFIKTCKSLGFDVALAK